MASHNISIKEEAYRFLKSVKSRDKSFSDVILGFKRQNKDPMRFFGALKDSYWAQKETEMASFRKSFEERIK